MPIMDGYHATRTTRTHEQFKNSAWIRNTPIVAMAASAIQGDRQKCQRSGIDYLTKSAKGELLEKMLVKCVIEGKPKWEFAQKDDQQAESSSSRKHPGTIFPKTHHTQYCNPLPIYPEAAAPKESSSIFRPQSLTTQLGQVRFERIAALLKSSEGDGDGILRRVDVERKTSSIRNNMLVWSGENTQARRAGCCESVELAERLVVPTHALMWDNISKLVAEQDGNLY